jgi:HSP20 family protein
MSVISWDPMSEIVSMRDELDRTFEDFFNKSPVRYEGFRIVDLDMYQTKDYDVVKVSIPGVKTNDIDVSVICEVLKIRGDIKQNEEVKGANCHLRKRRFGPFSRSIHLPAKLFLIR